MIRRWIKKLVGLVVSLAVLVGIIAGVAIVIAYWTVAPTAGTIIVDDIGAEITIRYDKLGRPFVQAETLEDGLFAEGFLHASHRLWQMELLKRAATGRLSSLLGASMVESDKELWRMGVPQLGKTLEKNASDEMRGYVQAYVNGINEALQSDTFFAPEYLLIQQQPAAWTPGDVYAMGALMAFQSANNSGNELLRLALVNELGADRAAIFMTHDGDDDVFPYIAENTNVTAALKRLDALDTLDQALMPSFALGSNGWVVGPQKSATGNALFAFDSHDDLGLPNLFYEVHLFFGEGRQIRGWSVAGLPGVINGYNERIAWGFTNIGDTQDLFLETRSEENPMLFKDGEDWYEARKEPVEIPVTGGQPVTFEIIHTKNGPLISEDPPIALRWTVQDIGSMGIDSILEFNLAQNWEEYTAALDGFAAPSLNATYADIDGTIGFRTAGLIPIRGNGNGLAPLNGDNPANRWQGYVDPGELPEIANPPKAFLAAANARVNRDGDGPLISADNAPGYRIRRINAMLQDNDALTIDDMRALQYDWYDQQAALLLPAIIDALKTGEWDETESAAIEAIRLWRGDPIANPDEAAPIIFQSWYRMIAKEVFEPAMSAGLFARLFKANYPLNHALDRLILVETDSEWWRGDRDGLLRAAFSAAVDEMRTVQGDDVSTWRLDAMHRVRLDHELGKAVKELGWFINATPAPWGGSATTVGRARYRYDRAYDVTAGATVRVIGEMQQPAPYMEAVIPGGQSGHPLSAHYTDQFVRWLAGETTPIANVPEDVPGDVLTLTRYDL